jgi:hypothetical protein
VSFEHLILFPWFPAQRTLIFALGMLQRTTRAELIYADDDDFY